MKILAFDCSAGPASAAVLEDGRVISSAFVNVKLTHSQTLMPMLENVLSQSLLSLDNIDCIAVNSGPGSFTGIRIGIAAVKGLAAPKNLPCVGVSTLLSMAYNCIGRDCTVCAVMDARCNQVYNALFDVSGGKITRLCEDRAVLCEDLAEEIKKISQNGDKYVIIVGDGADVFFPFVQDIPNVSKAEEKERYQNAVSVGLAAEEIINNGGTVTSEELLPIYLRLPQAERELKKRKEEKL